MSAEPPLDKQATPDITFQRLDGKIRRGVFTCGEREIDRWVEGAHKDHDQLKARVWAGHLLGNNAPAAVYGMRIRLESDADIEGDDGLFRRESGHFAAVQLCYLGVQRSLQRRGIGELMMTHAIREFGMVADKTGVCAMTLVAINGDKADWYRSLGFRPYGAPCKQPKLFLPARSAIEML